jgi:hypothetical protein
MLRLPAKTCALAILSLLTFAATLAHAGPKRLKLIIIVPHNQFNDGEGQMCRGPRLRTCRKMQPELLIFTG